MDVSTLSSSQAAAMGLIQGTGTTDTQTVNDVLAQSQDPSLTQTTDSQTGQSSVSQAGQTMSQLSQLATSNPSEFKTVTQKISQDLATAAKNESDPTKSKFLENLSEKFSEASQSGSTSSLSFHHGGKHHGHGSSAAGKYGGGRQQDSGLMSQVGSIISQDLAGASTTSATSSTSTVPAADSGTVSSGDLV